MSYKRANFYSLCFSLIFSLMASANSYAQVNLPAFLQKDETAEAISEARSDLRQAKKERKLAIAREQAAREAVDAFKAEGKLENVTEESPKQNPLQQLFNKETATSDPNQKPPANIKEARQQHRAAKKATKAAEARERLAREKLDVLQARRKVEKAERKANN